jgi:thioredoxin reductase (NADPH)
MFDLVIIGAGPAGIALAAEARAVGHQSENLLILEKGAQHNWAIRQFYPAHKKTTANYKGHVGQCEGLLCITDMTKDETIAFFDQVIASYQININYNVEAFAVERHEDSQGGHFHIETSKGIFDAEVLAIAIGILGRPNKPKEYRLPPSLKDRLMFDITTRRIENEEVLIVGGGDTASEYVQHLFRQGNRVTLSYRQPEFKRLNDGNLAALMSMEQRHEVTILRSSNIIDVQDEAGRPHVKFKEESYPARTFDSIVYALGGTTPVNFLRSLGVAFENGMPKTDRSGETSVPGLFLVGDLTVSKTGGSIITAFNSAARAIKRVDRLMRLEKVCAAVSTT